MIQVTASPMPSIQLPRQTIQPQARSVLFAGVSEKRDPMPRYGWRNLASLLVMVGGFMGANKLTTTVHQFHTWAEGQKFVRPMDRTTPKDRLLGDIAQLDRELQKDTGVRMAESVYLFTLKFQMLMVGLSALPGLFRKTIRLDQVYGELHQRGLTGQNLKVAVIDSGYNPGAGSSRNKVEFKPTDGEDEPITPYDDVGHGTAVTNLITSACPDSQVLVIPFASDAQVKQLTKDLNRETKAYIQQCFENPERLTLAGIRSLQMPVVRLIARGVRQAADEGAHVVNISLGTIENVEQTLRMMQAKVILSTLKASILGTSAPAKMIHLQEKISELAKTHQTNEALTPEIQAMMRPWRRALDYAHQKGTAVVVSAGNDGGHTFDQPDAMARINLLGAIEHPALIVVGSTRQNGQVSSFSTEYNDKIRPWVAANGSGELSTDIKPPSVPAWKYMFPPLWPFIPLEYIKNRVQYQNPQGTSFSAPDVAALLILMKSANPKLTTPEAKQILKDVAQPAHFGGTDRMRIRMEVVQRLLARQPGFEELTAGEKQKAVYTTCMADFVGMKTQISRTEIDAELKAELDRRTGHGTIAGRRLAAVDEAEKRGPKP